MTPEEHNKYLGWSHLIHGGLFLLMVIAILAMMSSIFFLDPKAPPPAFFAIMWVFMGGFYGLMLAPNLIAGYALLKRKPWAKMAAIVGAVTAAMSFPIGTAVSAYTFWFMFSEPGKSMYDKPKVALPPMPPDRNAARTQQAREHQYVPPTTPPDWR